MHCILHCDQTTLSSSLRMRKRKMSHAGKTKEKRNLPANWWAPGSLVKINVFLYFGQVCTYSKKEECLVKSTS